MNTNSKHYEILAIEPWEIMERNFTTEEFVAYLKGNIIKYTLRDKGQALTDAQKIKHYAEKLIEVLETKENDKDNWTIIGVKPKEVEDKHIIVKDSKFKIGDRVSLLAYLTGRTGTIIRQPVLGLRDIDKENYIVELDIEEEEDEQGWTANKTEHLVDSEHAWYVDDTEIELLQEEPEVKHKFKVGDRVVVYKGDKEERVGTIIRLPMKNSASPTAYIIELDKEELGWNSLRSIYGVNSDNAWSAHEYSLTLLEDKPKKTLKPYKWYDASLYTIEELKELLPVGTEVLVTKEQDNNRTVDLEEEETKLTEITNIGQRWVMKDTRVGVEVDIYWRRYFKIVEEN